jgi:conjugal transfer pilus assembly protein TraF
MKWMVLIGWMFMVCLCASSAAVPFYKDHAHGWHWYEPQNQEDKPETEPKAEQPKTTTSTKRKSPKEVVAAYREELENRMAEAWINPTPHKVKDYQEMQKDMLDRSANFSKVWMQSVFLNPELDHTISNPVNQRARHIQLDLQKKQVKTTIQNLAKEYGLFFFFSGGCEYCHEFAPIVKMFSDQYGWEVLPITLDGGKLEIFPNAQPDNGLFAQWKVGVMPALYAVNPNTGHVIPIALGMTSIDQMEIRIMSLVGQEIK